MTDIWDENPVEDLIKFINEEYPGYVHPPTIIDEFNTWLEKVKAESDCMSTVLSLLQSLGIVEKEKEDTEYDWIITSKFNELTKKADKWDELPRSVRRLFDPSTPEEFIQHYKDVDKAVDKLEAVKTWRDYWTDHPTKMPFKPMTELDEILEGEG